METEDMVVRRSPCWILKSDNALFFREAGVTGHQMQLQNEKCQQTHKEKHRSVYRCCSASLICTVSPVL